MCRLLLTSTYDQPTHCPVISRLSGLVKTLETDAFTRGKISRFPIPMERSLDDCAESGQAFPDLVPNQKERLICYVEDGGSTSNGHKWSSKLRLVCWGNADRFAVDANQLPAILIAHLTKRLQAVSAPFGDPVGNLKCSVVGVPDSATNLFSRYTYTETRSQFLLAPHFALAIDLQLTFTLNDCLIDLTTLPAEQC
jgi:hypothetical protein